MLRRIKNFFDQHLVPGALEDNRDPEHVLRLAIAALLLEMANVDGESWEEQRATAEDFVSEHFDLSEDEMAELLDLAEAERSEATDYYQFTSLVNDAYTPEQKLRLIEHLWRVAYANDSLHIYEEHLVRKIADLLHVPHSAFIAMKLRASTGS